ncbi:MAG: NDP-sugar synthase, partial [Pyrinomonadaceae bacterium]
RFGVRLHYVEEPTILGTSGALDNARALLDGDTFIVINGKLATDIDLAKALETHRRTEALVTLVLRRNHAREKYSTVETRDGLVLKFGPAPPPSASDNVRGDGLPYSLNDRRNDHNDNASNDEHVPLMFTGIQIVEPRIFSYIPRGIFSHTTTDVYPQAIARGERIAAHVAEGAWYELSTVKRYLDTSLALMKREGRDVEPGAGSLIEAGADVRDSVLWERVKIEAGARVHRAILGAGVVIPSGETIEDAAVVRAELVRDGERPSKGLTGEVRGANFVAPLPR